MPLYEYNYDLKSYEKDTHTMDDQDKWSEHALPAIAVAAKNQTYSLLETPKRVVQQVMQKSHLLSMEVMMLTLVMLFKQAVARWICSNNKTIIAGIVS